MRQCLRPKGGHFRGLYKQLASYRYPTPPQFRDQICAEGDLFFSLGERLPQPPQLPLCRDFLLGGRRRTSLVNDGVLRRELEVDDGREAGGELRPRQGFTINYLSFNAGK